MFNKTAEYYRKKYPVLMNELSRRTGAVTPVPAGYVVIGFTNDCNCRCEMCSIWEIYKKDPETKALEISASEWINTFSKSSLIREIPQGAVLSITGGEPFLRKDIVELVPGLLKHTPFSEAIIFTNGLLPERIGSMCEAILQRIPDKRYFSLQVSIDGVGEVHNKIRGRDSGFSRAVETVKLLQKLQKNFPAFRRLETGLVIQPDNIDTLEDVLAFRKEMNLPGGFMVQQELPYFNNIQAGKQTSGFSEAQQVRLLEFSRRMKILPGINKWVNNPSKRPLSCYAGYSSVYMDPYGDVYPCVAASGNRDFVMGNVRKSGLDEIWLSRQAWKVRKRVKQCRYTACWSGCEIHQTMVQHRLFESILKKLSLGYLDYFKLRGFQ